MLFLLAAKFGKGGNHLRWPLFLLGMAYILFVLSFTGPLTLILGQPQLVAPVLYTTLYVLSIAGGWLSLRLSMRGLGIGCLLLVSYLLMASLFAQDLKDLLIRFDDLGLRLHPIGHIEPHQASQLASIWLEVLHEYLRRNPMCHRPNDHVAILITLME